MYGGACTVAKSRPISIYEFFPKVIAAPSAKYDLLTLVIGEDLKVNEVYIGLGAPTLSAGAFPPDNSKRSHPIYAC